MKTFIMLPLLTGISVALTAQTGNVGIGTASPTNKLHVAATADPVKLEGLQVSTAGTLKPVMVDPATGVLKYGLTFTSNFYLQYTSATPLALTASIVTAIPFDATPVLNSPDYTYNAGTRRITFNTTGTYLISLQTAVHNESSDNQQLIGFRKVGTPDQWVVRGSIFPNTVPVTGALTIGTLQSVRAVINVTAGEVYYAGVVINAGTNITLIGNEVGGTGAGNVTNLLIQRVN
jgi:hypothetical protein